MRGGVIVDADFAAWIVADTNISQALSLEAGKQIGLFLSSWSRCSSYLQTRLGYRERGGVAK